MTAAVRSDNPQGFWAPLLKRRYKRPPALRLVQEAMHEHDGFASRFAPARIDIDQLQERLSSPNYERVRQSLKDAGFRSLFALLSAYAGQAADLRPWLEQAPINRDRDLRLEYLAGLGLNHNEKAQVYSELLNYRKFPKALFAGREAQQEALWELIERSRRKE